MRVLSLFSGIGGFDLGFERAGMEIVGMCEIDKHARAILAARFPNAVLHTDVREVHYDRGTIDIVCGGFPCQDVSVAGKRRGLAGERSGLWFEFARIIDESEPRWVVIENVPGLFSANGGRDFAVIIQWLAKRGYGVGWRVLDAQGFGLAQRRKRVFIVASFGTPSACTVLLECEGVPGHHRQGGQARENDTRTTADGAGNGGGIPDAARTLTASYGKTTWFQDRVTYIPTVANTLATGEGRKYSPDNETLLPATFAIDSLASNSMKSANPHSGIHHADIARTLDTSGTNPTANQGGNIIVDNTSTFVMREDATAGNFTIYPTDISLTLQALQPATTSHHAQMLTVQQMAPLAIGFSGQKSNMSVSVEVSPTLDISTVNDVSMPLIGVRRLTPTECERLQGFPDGWTAGQSDTQRYKQLGNAVAVPVAEWIGRRIMKGGK